MAGDSSHNTTFDEVVRLLEQEESYIRIFGLPDNQTTGAVSESASSTTTTPSLLDTAFLNETNADEQHGQISLSAAQSQTTKDAALTVYRVIDTILEQQPEIIRLGSTKKTMVSTGTMPMTPVKMTSFGTMPRTPPRTTSIGTTPTTPTPLNTTAASAAATFLSVSANDIIDLTSPTLSAIDPHSPGAETIDLRTPNTPTNTGSPQ